MKNLLIIIVVLFTGISCNFSINKNSKNIVSESIIQNIYAENNEESCCTFLTKDQNNNPVLSWIEGTADNSILVYSKFNPNTNKFGDKIKVLPSAGLSPHNEGMPKIAFKPDGTVVAVYGHRRRVNRPDAMFEGELYYTQSFNNGQSWTEPKYLHNDTTVGYSRGFFDIATLADGEIGAIWLDARKRLASGSTVYFAKTKNNEGFITDKDIAQKVCECCRTDIHIDDQGKISIAFRDIIKDSIRDVSYVYSTDNGNTFSEPVRVSEDNWILDGCPHSGPTITSDKSNTNIFWFTDGGGEGVYFSTSKKTENIFIERKLINPHARHPQATTLDAGTIILVWDEVFKTSQTFVTKIGLLVMSSDGTSDTVYLTDNNSDASYPVVFPAGKDKVIVAWTVRINNKNSISYTIVDLNNRILL